MANPSLIRFLSAEEVEASVVAFPWKFVPETDVGLCLNRNQLVPVALRTHLVGQLNPIQLKALTLNDVGKLLRDGESLRGRVKKDSNNRIYVYFEYQYRNGKKSRTVYVGIFPELSLAEIRAEHRRLKVELKKGVDPAEARRATKLANQVDIARQAEAHRAELQRLEAESDTRFYEEKKV